MTLLPPVLIAGVLVLAIAALIYARRAGLMASAIERQIIEFRSQLAAEHQEDLHQTQSAADRLDTQITELRKDVESRIDEASEGLDRLSRDTAALTERLDAVSNAVSHDVSELRSHLSSQAEELSGKLATLASAIEIVTRRPLQSFPVDAARLEARTEKEVTQLAQSIATLRPLVPYPKWRFDADWSNPDLAFLLRQRVWQYFSDRKSETPIVMPWHYGAQLRLYLGNDLSRQIYIAGCIDPNELAFLDRFLQPGMTFIDAGANEGVYTVFAAKRLGSNGTVWAFEPSRRELGRLEHNLELNNLTARVFPLALADSNGQAVLTIAGYGHEGLNTLGAFVYESIETVRTELIEIKRLDDVLLQNPPVRVDVMKLDVEGSELRLLRGAAETLRRYRPIVLFEASDAALRQQGGSRAELLEYLSTHQYDIYFFDPYSGLAARAIKEAGSDNMLAVPAGVPLPEAVYQPWPKGA